MGEAQQVSHDLRHSQTLRKRGIMPVRFSTPTLYPEAPT